MKAICKYLLIIVLFSNLIISCSGDKGKSADSKETAVDITVDLPGGSTVNLTRATLFSLSSTSDLNSKMTGNLPANKGSYELACLLDENDNVMLAGFIGENQTSINVETTTEVMLYYALDYYLLPDNAKAVFLENVRMIPGFSDLVKSIGDLFNADPLMYSKGTYLPLINAKINELSTKSTGLDLKRILIDGEDSKSGITVVNLDSVHIKMQNAFPRRTKVFIYKKSYYDRNGNLSHITNYLDNPVEEFNFEPGKQMDIKTLDVGTNIAQINAQNASVDNLSETGPIELPVNTSLEFLATYEVVVIGSGSLNSIDRDLSAREQKAYEELNMKTYALDFFLPALLDIGGNKGLLPPYGDSRETDLYNAVLPVLQSDPDVLDDIQHNDFKSASEILFPQLYGNVRLSDDLRTVLKNVYNVLSENGSMPNTFIQSQELIETGYPRTKYVLETMSKNMSFNDKFRTKARSVEQWSVNSIDAEVNLIPKEVKVCLGDATQIKVSYMTFTDPEVEDLEFHWETSNKFGGRVQDINDNPNNFGVSIVTSSNTVSYISTATESQLGSGDNYETVSVVIYAKNKTTGKLTEVGKDNMKVNNKKGCVSFFVSFTKEVLINSFSSIGCTGGMEYSLGHPTFVAEFKAVEGATSYKGRVLRKDGTYAGEFTLPDLEDSGDGMVKFKMGVGPIYVYLTCSEDKAKEEQQRRLDYLDEVGHQGIEITPVF
ncbi:hypothetical protein [Saccharicrinis sp. FJH54]|uniref:hypothetical protein n=1 Tax=Saccharicrinis sp. FJH54 TaxID=3344665 RepID=UPI0035D4F1D8